MYMKDIDYTAIGMRIRAARLNARMTQEQLAELTDFSITHISNIETGNTKLSLPALLNIANHLHVTADTLLCDSLDYSTKTYSREAQAILSDCSTAEIRALVDILKASKQSIRSHLETQPTE